MFAFRVHGPFIVLGGGDFAGNIPSNQFFAGIEPLQKLIDRPFEARHPLDKVNLINELRNLRFEKPGSYQILIEVDEEPLLVNSITVSE